ncbi:MAG: DUF962 domain-containing protein [Oligoflexales bacterium]
MKSIHEWLSEYEESHKHPKNVLIHKVCVPAIMFSILGLLWIVPIGFANFNCSQIFVAITLIFYAKLSIRLCLGMICEVGIMLAVIWHIQQSRISLLATCLFIFIIAWIFQFFGHKIEGKKPSFFQDLFFLLIGPLWTLNLLYKRLGIRV